MNDNDRPAQSRAKLRSTGGQAAVLVIDDDRDIADAIGDVLRAGGYQVEIVDGGAPALARAASAPPDLVLLDWRLPSEPAGAALVRRLREQCGPLPIVVLSADPHSLAEARQAQVSDYVPKPFDVADLLHVVDTWTR